MFVEQKATFLFSITPADASNKAVKWWSANPNIATVNEFGSVSAISQGEVIIKVISVDGDKSSECKLIVDPKEIPVEEIKLDKTDMTLTSAGAQGTIAVSILPANATYKNISWYSSNRNVATVSNGVVTARGKGTTLIIATSQTGSKKAVCIVNVNF